MRVPSLTRDKNNYKILNFNGKTLSIVAHMKQIANIHSEHKQK